MTPEIVAQAVVSGLLMGLIYALVAAGLSLIFGLMEIVNFAHGEFLMLAMFASFWAWALFRLDPLLSLPLSVSLLAGVGVLTYRGIVARILGAPGLVQVFATFGLAVFLRSLAQFLWTPDFRLVQSPWVSGRVGLLGIYVGTPQMVAALAALAGFGALHWFITRTETGLALQATAQDRQAAALLGIAPQRMFTLGWALGAGCVGLAGGLLVNFYYVFPDVGALFALLAYVTVALGGFGRVSGTLLAGVLVGLVEVLVGLWAPAFKYVGVFVLYLAVVLLRPQGLFGKV